MPPLPLIGWRGFLRFVGLKVSRHQLSIIEARRIWSADTTKNDRLTACNHITGAIVFAFEAVGRWAFQQSVAGFLEETAEFSLAALDIRIHDLPFAHC